MRRTISMLGLLCVICLAGLSECASAATLLYDEAVNGDLAGDFNAPTPIGTFVPGVNTVTGTHIYPDGQFEGDTFSVDLPSTLAIVDISLEISNFVPGPTISLSSVLEFFSQSFSGDTFIPFANIFDAFPLARLETYVFGVQYNIAGESNGYAWTWTIQTATVPEPSTLVFAIVGLAGLGFVGLRKMLGRIATLQSASH